MIIFYSPKYSKKKKKKKIVGHTFLSKYVNLECVDVRVVISISIAKLLVENEERLTAIIRPI